MQTISINFIVPQGWHELGDKQLRYVYQLLADGFASHRYPDFLRLTSEVAGGDLHGGQQQSVEEAMNAQIRALFILIAATDRISRSCSPRRHETRGAER